MPEPREVLAGRLKFQADACAELGSPFYAALLHHAVADLETEGALWGVLAGFEAESGWAALALRLMAAVHRLVLEGSLPELARHYPSAGGDGDAEAAWPPFRAALLDRRDEVRALVARPCQTNEVGRSAALLGGFLEVAHRTLLPLRILEIGASAGLNLRWDHYRYESGVSSWGDPDSPVRFTDAPTRLFHPTKSSTSRGPRSYAPTSPQGGEVPVFEVPPPLNRRAVVAERKGCDLHPIDATTADGSLTLRSFIWADQVERFRLLEGAIAVARQVPVVVERIDAGAFVERELAAARSGVATVVYHSVVRQYVGEESRTRIAAAIDSAQARATVEAPVSYLHMEPGDAVFEVRLDGELIEIAGAHGRAVRWLPETRSGAS